MDERSSHGSFDVLKEFDVFGSLSGSGIEPKIKRTKQYFVDATRKYRIKRKREERDVKQTYQLLFQEQCEMLKVIRCLNSEIDMLLLNRKYPQSNQSLSYQNSCLKEEVREYRTLTANMRDYILRFSAQVNLRSEVSLLYNNLCFLFDKTEFLKNFTSQQPPIKIDHDLVLSMRNECIQNFNASSSWLLNDDKSTFENVRREVRICKTEKGLNVLRMDCLDVPLRCERISKFFARLENFDELLLKIKQNISALPSEQRIIKKLPIDLPLEKLKIYNPRFTEVTIDSAKSIYLVAGDHQVDSSVFVRCAVPDVATDIKRLDQEEGCLLRAVTTVPTEDPSRSNVSLILAMNPYSGTPFHKCRFFGNQFSPEKGCFLLEMLLFAVSQE